MMSSLTIVLATYNGMRFLPEQWQSLQQQTACDWTLLVRDDGSQDGTVEWLQQQARRDDRLLLIQDDLGRLGIRGNYEQLLQRALIFGADYVAFADQDDRWHPEKLARQLSLIQTAETTAAFESTSIRPPLLVHSDLRLINEQGNLVHQSFFRYQRLQHVIEQPLGVLFVQNFVTGCSVLVNRPLLDLMLPLPATIVMHDWWAALLAAATGQILWMAEPLTDYRQHDDNAVGALGYWNSRRFWQKLWRQCQRNGWQGDWHEFLVTVEQTVALYCRLLDRHSQRPRSSPLYQESLALTRHYLDLLNAPTSGWQRCRQSHRLGIRRLDWFRQLLLWRKFWQWQPNLLPKPRLASQLPISPWAQSSKPTKWAPVATTDETAVTAEARLAGFPDQARH